MTESYIRGYLDTELGLLDYRMSDSKNVLLSGEITFEGHGYHIVAPLKDES